MLMYLCKDFDLEKRTVLAKLLIEDFHEDVIFKIIHRCIVYVSIRLYIKQKKTHNNNFLPFQQV